MSTKLDGLNSHWSSYLGLFSGLLAYKETKTTDTCAVRYGSHKVREDIKINEN